MQRDLKMPNHLNSLSQKWSVRMKFILWLIQRTLYFFFFLICRLTFETALKLRGGPSIVFAHSLGNNVFRYFLEWLKLEIAPKHYNQWLDEHIHAYFAVGMVFLHHIHLPRWWSLLNWLNCIHLSWLCCLVPGAPLLGAIETVKATFFGNTFGLPVSEVTHSFVETFFSWHLCLSINISSFLQSSFLL